MTVCILHVNCGAPTIRSRLPHSEVSVEDHRERLALIMSLPDRTPELSGAGIPSCFPDPSLLSRPSLPFSGRRHPTTRLSSEPQDTAAKSSPLPTTTAPGPSQLSTQICAHFPLHALDPSTSGSLFPQDLSNSRGSVELPVSSAGCRVPCSLWSLGHGQGWVRCVSAPAPESASGREAARAALAASDRSPKQS